MANKTEFYELHLVLTIGYIAQWLERMTADQQVPGSDPGVPFPYMRAMSRLVALRMYCSSARRQRDREVKVMDPLDVACVVSGVKCERPRHIATRNFRNAEPA